MKGLVYISQARKQFTGLELVELNDLCVRANAKHGVTGYLYYHFGCFMQYVEGQDKDIEQLYRNLLADQRHKIRCHFEKPIDTRLFNDWSMKYLYQQDVERVGIESRLTSFMRNAETQQPTAQDCWHMVTLFFDEFYGVVDEN